MKDSPPPAIVARDWLARRPEQLEPGLRLGEPAPALDLPLAPALAGPDALGRPCFVFLCDSPPDIGTAETLLETAARLREARHALEAWYARPAEPRLLLVAPVFPLPLHGRLRLVASGLDLFAWSCRSDPDGLGQPLLRLELPGPLRHPVAAIPPFPQRQLERLRRLLLHADPIRPPLRIHGGGWPLHFIGETGCVAALHRDGDEAIFVTRPAGERAVVLRIEDEESVDRALDALLRAQYERALLA